jgi:protease IV
MRNACLALTAALLLVTMSPCDLTAQTKKAEATEPIIAVFDLNGAITEKPLGEDLGFPFGPANTESLHSLVTRMKEAAENDEVKGVVLLLGSAGLGRGQTEEIRDAISQIKSAGKKVHIHADWMMTSSYALLSGASRLSVVPTGHLLITGMYGEQPYLRGLLEKIGVTPDFLTCGRYKSAGEMFMRTEPSEEDERMTNWLFDGLYENTIRLIAEGRGTQPDKVRTWIDGGIYTAESAQKLGIIDAVQYRQDFLEDLKKEYGDDLKLDKKYGRKKKKEIDFSNPFAMFSIWAELLTGGTKPKKSDKDAIAIVYVDGAIMPGQPIPSPFGSSGYAYSTPIRKALDKAATDDTVKAVVLRVDSPGGSAVASEIILNATKRVAAKKPLIVSMGNIAGSGGYYVACGAETILADPSTINGSIGVVSGKFATTEMWSKMGINWKSYGRGANAGLLGSETTFSDAERKKLQDWMDEVYEVFKGHVVSIRGDRLKKDIDEIAGGRVFTGRQALDLGLVDQLGGLDDAIQHIAKKAKLKDYEVRVIPRPKNIMELMFADLTGEKSDDGTLSLSQGILPQRNSISALDLALPYLKHLTPHRRASIITALRMLDLVQQEHVILAMPVYSFQNGGTTH